MSWTSTKTEMLAELRVRGGWRRSTTLTDEILTEFLNAGIAEVHDLIAKFCPDFLVKSADLVTVANVATVDLPTDFYRLRVLQSTDGVSAIRLRSYSLDEETYIDDSTVWDPVSGVERPRYMLQAGYLRFVPIPTSVLSLKLWYVPHATRLVSGSLDVFDLGTIATNTNAVIEAQSVGDTGMTIAFVADGTGAGTLDESAYPVMVFHFQDNVTLPSDFEAAVAASTYLAVSAASTITTPLTSNADTFTAQAFTGGTDDTVYNGVNGHEELVYQHAMLLAKQRDRLPTDDHERAIARLENRLRLALPERDQSEPEYLPDLGRAGLG